MHPPFCVSELYAKGIKKYHLTQMESCGQERIFLGNSHTTKINCKNAQFIVNQVLFFASTILFSCLTVTPTKILLIMDIITVAGTPFTEQKNGIGDGRRTCRTSSAPLPLL